MFAYRFSFHAKFLESLSSRNYDRHLSIYMKELHHNESFYSSYSSFLRRRKDSFVPLFSSFYVILSASYRLHSGAIFFRNFVLGRSYVLFA